jgi:hypothetical protein
VRKLTTKATEQKALDKKRKYVNPFGARIVAG